MNGPWQSSNIFSNLTPGVYDVWVRDPATGELEEYMGNSITLTEPSPLSFFKTRKLLQENNFVRFGFFFFGFRNLGA